MVTDMARAVEESKSDDTSLPAARLVPLALAADGREAIGQPPLLLVHAIGGTVQSYAPLAQRVKDVYSVVGIEAFGLSGEHEPVDSLTEIVERYVGTVRAAWPCGPYRLGGWSMGGIVAFEMARRLEQEGAEVAFVALLDSSFTLTREDLGLPSSSEEGPVPEGASTLVARFAEDIADSLGWRIPTTGAAVIDPLGWLAATITGEDGNEAARDYIDTMRAELESRFRVFHAHAEALAHYVPTGPVAADLLLLTPDQSFNVNCAQRWAEQTSGHVHHARVNGNHYTFLRPPVVGEVAVFVRTASAHHGLHSQMDGWRCVDLSSPSHAFD
ncbi:alpha/beta fold hydrolase [Streptomyces sp. NPDC056672]|uniref:thioesterase domain-containing protein n=1 Tax=Streptomyces sp. NPDC056672 TaxID=3345906 RepID=UPI0036B1DA3D